MLKTWSAALAIPAVLGLLAIAPFDSGLAALAQDKVAPKAKAEAPAAPAPQAQDGKAAFKLGVVNLKTCFGQESYEKVKDVEADLKKLAEEYKKQVEDLQKKEQTLEEQIKALTPQQSLYQDKLFQLRKTQSERKIIQEMGKVRITEHYTDAKRAVFNEIQRVCELLGKEQKFDLILRVEEPQLEEKDDARIETQIISRLVLYANETVDITPLVLKRLNEEYKKQKTGGEKK